MPAILQFNPSAFLTIVGFGPEEGECREQVRRLGLQAKVNFLGAKSQHELPSLYQRSAMFVAPFVSTPSGDQEGLGLVTVEAAGCGCPVIASDLQAIRDVFDQTQAMLVAPGSVAAIASAVCAVFANPPSLRSLEAVRASLRGKFDWSVVAARYSRILLKITDMQIDDA